MAVLVIFIVFVVLMVVGALYETRLLEILSSVLEDRANRNDRGKGKRDSEKYVTR